MPQFHHNEIKVSSIHAYIYIYFFYSEMFEIKTFSMVIFEKLPWFYWVQIRFFTLNIFSPANALVKRLPKIFALFIQWLILTCFQIQHTISQGCKWANEVSEKHIWGGDWYVQARNQWLDVSISSFQYRAVYRAVVMFILRQHGAKSHLKNKPN